MRIRHWLIGLTIVTQVACEQAAETDTEQMSGQAQSDRSSVVAYTGARLIVGDGSEPIENAVFIVEEGKFTLVGAASEVEVSANMTQVDLTGMTVMPAIIDAHTHLGSTRESLLNDLQRRAYFGISAALSLGIDAEGTPLEMRSEIIPGAALYRSAGLGITAPEPGRTQVHWVTNENEARAAVRTEAAREVDVIKIWVDDRNGQFEKLSPALYGAIIDEAHKNDLLVAAHIFTLEDAKTLVRSGVDIFAHGVRDRDIDDEFIALIKEHSNVVLIPNLPGRGIATDLDWLAGSMPNEELDALKQSASEQGNQVSEAFAIQARNLNRLSQEGMTIAFGTDGNNPWSPHVEMEDMVAAGMTPAQVIKAATLNAAEVAGFSAMGSIEPGNSADFIVLQANPLNDITNTRLIESVFLHGDAVER